MDNQSISMDEVTQIIGALQLNLTLAQKKVAMLERENAELKKSMAESKPAEKGK